MRRHAIAFLFVGLVVSWASLKAETAQVSEVMVFKENLALVRQKVRLMAGANGWVAVEGIAPATMGSVRITEAATDLPLTTMVREEEVQSPIDSISGLFRANVGKSIVLRTTADDGKTMKTTVWEIVSVLEPEQKDPQTRPHPYGYNPGGAPIGVPMVALKSVEGLRVQPTTAFSELTFVLDADPVTFEERKQPRLFCKAPQAEKEFEAQVEYLTPGARWMPTYHLRLEGANKALLALQAEVVNDTVEWKDALVTFVGGVPNFRYKDFLSGLSPHNQWPSMNPFLFGVLAPWVNPQQRQYEEWQSQQAPYSNVAYTIPQPADVAAGPTFEGGDLHFYTLEKLSLPKGGRGKFALWSQNLECRHGYSLRYNPNREGAIRQELRNRGRETDGLVSDRLAEEKLNRVWHIVTMQNNSKNPWTSGPAFAFQDGKPLSQEIFFFTAVGAETDFFITAAPDITYTVCHNEIKRTPNARAVGGNSYEGVLEEWEMEFTNRRAQAAPVKFEMEIGGEVSDFSLKPSEIQVSSFDAQDWQPNYGNYQASRHSSVTSRLEVPSAGKAKLGFTRTYYYR